MVLIQVKLSIFRYIN